jgi:hypothetical protein
MQFQLFGGGIQSLAKDAWDSCRLQAFLAFVALNSHFFGFLTNLLLLI